MAKRKGKPNMTAAEGLAYYDSLQDDLDGLDLRADLALERSLAKAPWGSKGGKSHKTGPSCHASHPELVMGNGVLLGASCNHPRPGFDVYVGFDYGQHMMAPSPWQPAANPPILEGHFRISDGQAPTDPVEFKQMVDWLAAQLDAGKRVHIGCIGGHGRTGLVIAALHTQLTGDKDAITWVRKHHCKKAVETTTQVEFLHKHYGITSAKATKGWSSSDFYNKYTPAPKGGFNGSAGMTAAQIIKDPAPDHPTTLTPVRGPITLL